MTGPAPERSRAVHLEVFGALDTDSLDLMVQLAQFTICSGCVEMVLQLRALTDFPTRLFAELRRLDRVARLHHCHLQLLGLTEAVAAVACTTPARQETRPALQLSVRPAAP
jgi:hypothetical protein